MLTKADWENDWRNRGQTEYLAHKHLQKVRYAPPSEKWTHDHCEFCWATFSDYGEGDLREGYTTDDWYCWICEECYQDLKAVFCWDAEGTELADSGADCTKGEGEYRP